MPKKKKKKQQFYPLALTIAGSDSGGGAGVQADLRTFSAFGVYGSSVITAVTAQNPNQVLRVDGMPAEAVTAQLEAVSTLNIKAIKTGMLFDAAIIDSVADELADSKLEIVVDPVMISTSGAKLLADDAAESLVNKLLPLATWITPNIPEAEFLTGNTISTLDEMAQAATIIAEKWSCNVVLKGGHLESHVDEITDLVVYNGQAFSLVSPVIHDCNATHGTGCTFSAALASAFALELEWDEALCAAKSFVFGSLNEAVPIAEGIEAMYPPSYAYNDNVGLVTYE